MKIRTGFVSNSSTSSFCIYGVCIDRCKFCHEDSNDDCEADCYDIIEKLEASSNLQVHNGDDDCVYIGRDYSECGDDETMGNFKKRVREDVSAILDQLGVKVTEKDFSHQLESYYC